MSVDKSSYVVKRSTGTLYLYEWDDEQQIHIPKNFKNELYAAWEDKKFKNNPQRWDEINLVVEGYKNGKQFKNDVR